MDTRIAARLCRSGSHTPTRNHRGKTPDTISPTGIKPSEIIPVRHLPLGIKTGEPRHRFTRGRGVEHTARTFLSTRGYQVFSCVGARSPIDLIAWRPDDNPALIKTERTRYPAGSAAQVAKNYAGDIDALRTVRQPRHARLQLWIFAPREDVWRIFHVYPGGIAEVAECP